MLLSALASMIVHINANSALRQLSDVSAAFGYTLEGPNIGWLVHKPRAAFDTSDYESALCRVLHHTRLTFEHTGPRHTQIVKEPSLQALSNSCRAAMAHKTITLNIKGTWVNAQLNELESHFQVSIYFSHYADLRAGEKVQAPFEGLFDLDHAICFVLKGSGLTYRHNHHADPHEPTEYQGDWLEGEVRDIEIYAERPGDTWTDTCTPRQWLNVGPKIELPTADWAD